MASRRFCPASPDVAFQEVVHSVPTEEAEVVEALANLRRSESTLIGMRPNTAG